MFTELLRTNKVGVGTVTAPMKEYSLLGASVKGNGSVDAVITVEGSHNDITWVAILHFELKGKDKASGEFALGQIFPFVRGRLDSIVGDEVVLSIDTPQEGIV
jgi:hypothetical protein